MKKKWIKDLTLNEVIHAPTEEIAKKLCSRFNRLGLKWKSGDTYLEMSNFEKYNSDTCYRPALGEFSYKGFYIDGDFTFYTIEELIDFNEEYTLPKKWYIKGGRQLIKFLKTQNTAWSGDSWGWGYYAIGNAWDFGEIKQLAKEGYVEITVEQYKKAIMEEKDEPIIFSVQNQKDTIEMACEVWRKKLAKLFGYTIALNKEYECSKEQFEEFLKESTRVQKEKFKEMFPHYFQPKIEKDTLVYVREGKQWYMKYFSHFNSEGKIYCFNEQKKSKEANHTSTWDEYSLTNPLETK